MDKYTKKAYAKTHAMMDCKTFIFGFIFWEKEIINFDFLFNFQIKNSFQQGDYCVKCHSSCKTCSGQSDHDCKDSATVGEKDCATGYKTFTDSN